MMTEGNFIDRQPSHVHDLSHEDDESKTPEQGSPEADIMDTESIDYGH